MANKEEKKAFFVIKGWYDITAGDGIDVAIENLNQVIGELQGLAAVDEATLRVPASVIEFI